VKTNEVPLPQAKLYNKNTTDMADEAKRHCNFTTRKIEKNQII
jgi:hypothetical protein